MIERRKYVRIPESSPISYRIMPNVKIGSFVTKDISQGGIRFSVHEFIPKGSFLKIRFTIEKLYFSFEALVRIVWIVEQPRSEKFEIGVEFVNIPKQTTDHLIDYIRGVLHLR